MRLKFWKKQQRKNPFEASLVLDNPDIKIVEARYNEKPVFFGIGTSKQTEREIGGKVGTEGVGGKYVAQKELEWKMYYNKDTMPSGFIPIDKLEDLMKGTTAVVSGSISAYGTTSQNFRPVEKEDYNRTIERIEKLRTRIAERKKPMDDWTEEWKDSVKELLDRLALANGWKATRKKKVGKKSG